MSEVQAIEDHKMVNLENAWLPAGSRRINYPGSPNGCLRAWDVERRMSFEVEAPRIICPLYPSSPDGHNHKRHGH